jgi:mRNA interferase YafQ
MCTPVYSRPFGKDVSQAKRRGKNLEKFKIIAHALVAGESLDPIHRDHRMVGSWAGRRECHMESEWRLIYKIDGARIIFERMGTHADMFRK